MPDPAPEALRVLVAEHQQVRAGGSFRWRRWLPFHGHANRGQSHHGLVVGQPRANEGSHVARVRAQVPQAPAGPVVKLALRRQFSGRRRQGLALPAGHSGLKSADEFLAGLGQDAGSTECCRGGGGRIEPVREFGIPPEPRPCRPGMALPAPESSHTELCVRALQQGADRAGVIAPGSVRQSVAAGPGQRYEVGDRAQDSMVAFMHQDLGHGQGVRQRQPDRAEGRGRGRAHPLGRERLR